MTRKMLLLFACLACAVAAQAQDTEFFTDASLLKPWDSTPRCSNPLAHRCAVAWTTANWQTRKNARIVTVS